jgi:ABC-type phosphate transport system substrate-binding protein
MKNHSKSRLVVALLLTASAAAHAEIVVVVNPNHPAARMTPEQVANIYLGKDTRFRPVDLPESNRQRHWFYYKLTGRDVSQVKTIWARLLYRTRAPKVAIDSAEAVRLVGASENAIAYVDKSAVDASVKPVMTIQTASGLGL